ncbi:FAD-binding monooxygenase [Streptomyces kaniharaensis]|uniref:FAD-binding monooxygenase n=1 Tax=Streptomyces kaniharaensis TaxID=212423 RepID=A0A6N7KKI3_9ACTN|nr:FAD-dependent monooxygenase [Streptomyces kaniharaensis]MQS10724.1 FAD-binding monooxygenase [Streptomyces kaniharaensis]
MAVFVGDRAVVLGASVAGLLAARLLADAYRSVTLVDRDALTPSAGPRRTVPQGRHIHGLLARGQQVLEDLFPGLTKELAELGVPVRDFGTGLNWYFNGRMIRKAETGLTCVSAERPLLEARVRERVLALHNVTLVDRCDIIGLDAAPDRRRITGVRVQPSDGTTEQLLDADLVVDATGRGSRTPRWLHELGYPQVPEERVKIDLTYTTAEFAAPLPVDPIGDGIGLVCVAGPGRPRGATLVRLRDRYALSLYGLLGERPPTDPAGFLAYAKALPVPEIHAAVEHARMLTEPVSMHFPANVRHRYERMDRLPDGLLVMGDAACVFNPIYAQGMTVAATEAVVLRTHLERGLPPRPQDFFRDLAAAIDAPWDMAVGGDLGFPGVQGRRTLKVRMGNLYLPRLQAAAAHDGHLSTAFLRAAGLVDPPQALMRPVVVYRVLRRAGRH